MSPTIQNKKFTIIARKENEDILKWMDKVINKVGEEHFNTSPHCMVKELTNIMIPINDKENSYIGSVIEKKA